MVEKDNRLIGQLELTIKKYEDRKIGYVNLYYLVPDFRGIGIGKELQKYASSFFKSQNHNEFHLRVSPTNTSA
jgi:GNAT superfamily N-acetyltransferase